MKWKRPTIYLTDPAIQIDFGGIGKEYATDCLALIASERGIKHGLINLGGDLRVIGPHPDGTPWRLGIKHPRISHKVLKIFELYSGSLATSGDYERFFEVAGERYCHILNPLNGMPTKESRSVTVLAESCLVAGSLSTISMLRTSECAYESLKGEGCKFYLVDNLGLCWDEHGSVGTSSSCKVMDAAL